jgi:alpha-glucuronidase
VANLGNATNLTGHHFSQANLYAFGRQAWDWKLDSDDIAEDWVRMTWSADDRVVDDIVELMMGSWEALVSYQTPLGIGHQFRSSDHYGPKPDEFFIKDDWSPVYYNQADAEGLGYDRSPTGSNFTAQYFPPLERRYGDIDEVPENLMMWFHHVPWDFRMDNGRLFWDELVLRYQTGVQYVTWMRETWDRLAPYIDDRRFAEVQAKLAQHEIDAADWRDTSVGYWRTFSGRAIPTDGPLAVEITVGGKRFGGFDASAASYEIPAAGPITKVRTARGARYRILEQSRDRAVVQVRGRSFFGPIVKNYVFEMSSR